MTFLSYSQNSEDIILYRALKHIPGGFYIDAGAGHPVDDSVTFAFYKLGWRGINIEPVDTFHDALCRERSEDINLKLALAGHRGEVQMHVSEGSGLSTVKDDYACMHRKAGFEFEKKSVKCTTLDALCNEYKPGTVHFLKIDVEGSEKDVIKGFSFDKVRPWILVVEATIPSTGNDVSSDWEKDLLDADYKMVYFDGLNKFYLAEEHPELEKHFILPPNVFDEALPASFFQCQNALHEARMLLADKKNEIEKYYAEVTDLTNSFQKKINNLTLTNEQQKKELACLLEDNRHLNETNRFLCAREKLIVEQTSILSEHIFNFNPSGLKSRLDARNAEIEGIYSTISWRLTAPLRHCKIYTLRFLTALRSMLGRKPAEKKNNSETMSRSAKKIYAQLKKCTGIKT